MPFALVVIGLLMIVTGARDTHKAFAQEVASDIVNAGTCAPLRREFEGCGFLWWIAAIIAVGAMGYSETLRPVSRAFLALIIVVMFVSNQGFFANLQQALELGPEKSPEPEGTGGGASASEQPGLAGNLAARVGGMANAAQEQLKSDPRGLTGDVPGSEGQQKANRWINYFVRQFLPF